MKHETPSQEIFEEIKQAAISVWNKYDDTYGYASEKKAVVNSLENYEDNVMVCYRMFDWENQRIMRSLLSEEANDYIRNNE